MFLMFMQSYLMVTAVFLAAIYRKISGIHIETILKGKKSIA